MAGPVLPSDPIDKVATLGAPARRRLYDYVAARPEPVGRDEAAGALGIGRPLAAFHLDQLVQAGLLDVEYRRLQGRNGPGAGRPAKLYRRAAATVEVSLPQRRYGLAAEVMASALECTGPGPSPELIAAAHRAGRDLVAPGQALSEVLEQAGFEPEPEGLEDSSRAIRLRNCPFEALRAGHRELTCAMNRALLEGVLAGVFATTGDDRFRAEPETVPGFCCVALVPATAT
jgi:predicted ArsR family transcriptional regulator